MIYDTLNNLPNYLGVSDNLDTVIEYIMARDITTLPAGRTRIVGTGQGRLTNGFISLCKPIHAASFFLLPYVTLRNSPQLTGNLV